MKTKVLSDSEYAEAMAQRVEPYLKEHSSEKWLDRSHGKQYCVRYCGDESPKAVIVMSHGFTESAEKFKELAWYFVSEGYCVYIADHCGHGNSYRMTEDPSLIHVDRWKRLTDDLTDIANLAKSEYPGLPIYLYGHSMGGGVAAAEAALEPQLFDKVILSSPMICPKLGNFPIFAAKLIAEAACKVGLGGKYAIGQSKYSGKGEFSGSAGSSRERFDYYEEKREKNENLQTSGSSYSGVREAFRLNDYLQHEAWRHICRPVLIFQAESDAWVDNFEMNEFVYKLRKNGKAEITALRVVNAKHEIYNTQEKHLAHYLERIFEFLER